MSKRARSQSPDRSVKRVKLEHPNAALVETLPDNKYRFYVNNPDTCDTLFKSYVNGYEKCEDMSTTYWEKLFFLLGQADRVTDIDPINLETYLSGYEHGLTQQSADKKLDIYMRGFNRGRKDSSLLHDNVMIYDSTKGDSEKFKVGYWAGYFKIKVLMLEDNMYYQQGMLLGSRDFTMDRCNFEYTVKRAREIMHNNKGTLISYTFPMVQITETVKFDQIFAGFYDGFHKIRKQAPIIKKAIADANSQISEGESYHNYLIGHSRGSRDRDMFPK